MKAPTVKTDPIIESIARKFSGVEGLPVEQQRRLIARGVRHVAKEIQKLIDQLGEAKSKNEALGECLGSIFDSASKQELATQSSSVIHKAAITLIKNTAAQGMKHAA